RELRELERQLRHRDRERERRECEVDAREPERGDPDEQAAHEADGEREREREDEVRVVVVRHERRRVAADRHERSVADGDLARVAREDVQAEDGDEVDGDASPGALVVARERERQERDDDVAARSHTRRTWRRPKSPLGLKRRTTSRTAKAIGSRNSEVAKPTYWPIRLRKTPR